jgi:hypothetical protein
MFTVEVKGLRELQAKFQKLPQTLKAQANGMIEEAARLFVRNAQADVQHTGITDIGGGVGLSGSIGYEPKPVRNLSVEIKAHKEYAPYVEFGTITNVFKGYASGSLGAFTSGLQASELLTYAKTFETKNRKRFTGGMFPRPYFFKQLGPAKAQLEADLKLLLKDEKL